MQMRTLLLSLGTYNPKSPECPKKGGCQHKTEGGRGALGANLVKERHPSLLPNNDNPGKIDFQ